MKRQLTFIALLVMTVIISVGAISANEIVTDSYATNLVDDSSDVSVPSDNTADSSEDSVSNDANVDSNIDDSSKVSLSSEEVLGSENSNSLSTNTLSDSLGASDTTPTKANTTISAQNTNVYYNGGKLSMTLKDSAGKGIAGQTLVVTINGQTYKPTTDANGLASVDITFNPGKYTATVNYGGNDNYNAASQVSAEVTVLSTIQSKDITKYYKGSTKYSATFLTTQGTPLANKNVKITVNGKTYTKKTNAKGVVSFAINLKPGTYKVIAQDPVTGYKVTNTFKILSTITASSITKVYTDGKLFSAKFYKANGKVLAKKTIKFKINGKVYKKKTNANGVAYLSLKSLKKGTYKIISYNTDGLTKSNTVKVVRSTTSKLTTSPYTYLTSDSKTVKVTLTNGLGYAPSAGKVIKFTINGKTYSAKTNSKGVASLKLPKLNKGVYTIKYKFAGSSFYKASSATNKVTIIPSKTPTYVVKSGTTFTYNSGSSFKVALTSGGVPLEKRTVTLNVDGKTYTKTTDSNGIVSLPVDLTIGKHTITYTNKAESKVNSKTDSAVITVNEKISKYSEGYWLYGSDMKSVDLSNLASKGTNTIFLNYYAVKTYGSSEVESWIANANKVGISVHIWMQTFYESGVWTNPVANGKENTAFFTQKINEAKSYAAIKGVSGIHFDYLRYPGTADKTTGGTDAISSFVKQAVSAVKSVNSNLIVSAALMPETTSSAQYYGQDYSVISQYMDVVIPMVYKGNYKKDTSWITTTTKWYVDNSKGAKVWTGLQGYNSDDDTTKLSVDALNKDITAALDGSASGAIIFRYGASNIVDFNSLDTTASASKSVSISSILTGATNLKNYYENNKVLPSTVTISEGTFTLPEFLYLMSKAIEQLGNSNTKAITSIPGVNAPSAPSGDTINSVDLTKANFLTVAKNVANYIATNKQAPNYASSAAGKIIYSEVVDSFARILAFYKTNNRLPSYVTVSYNSASSSLVTGNGLNQKVTLTEAELKKYLAASTNCQVNDASITKIVNSVTKGLTSDYDKANAIFKYVRDTLSYSFYYNTKYGAVKTLSVKTGNCVDHSHLLVAMFRNAGLAARYVHGSCTFTSGSNYGHVWTQVYVNGQWYVADATSSKNTLGKVSNWNTKTFSLKGTYSSLSF